MNNKKKGKKEKTKTFFNGFYIYVHAHTSVLF